MPPMAVLPNIDTAEEGGVQGGLRAVFSIGRRRVGGGRGARRVVGRAMLVVVVRVSFRGCVLLNVVLLNCMRPAPVALCTQHVSMRQAAHSMMEGHVHNRHTIIIHAPQEWLLNATVVEIFVIKFSAPLVAAARMTSGRSQGIREDTRLMAHHGKVALP